MYYLLSIYSILIAIMLWDCDAAFLYYRWEIFIYSIIGLFIFKYEPLWQKVSIKSLILRWLLIPVGLLFKFVNVFSQFCNNLPLEKGGALILNKLESLSPKGFCAKFGWNWLSGSGEKAENVKSVRQRRQRRRTTDKFWSEKLTWASVSGELKRHENWKFKMTTYFVIADLKHWFKITNYGVPAQISSGDNKKYKIKLSDVLCNIYWY